MKNVTDQELIRRFLNLCISRDYTQAQVGEIVGRTQGWASALYLGRIRRLSFQTRNRVLSVLADRGKHATASRADL
jgi:ATP/maltotriose-dependent transcriptional regulator MalT